MLPFDNPFIEEIAEQREAISQAVRGARSSLEKLGSILSGEQALEARITEIPEGTWGKSFLYDLLVAYAQGSDSLQIFAEEENVPYTEVKRVIKYLGLHKLYTSGINRGDGQLTLSRIK